MSKWKHKIKATCIFMLSLIALACNFIYLGTIDTEYAIKFHELIEYGEISDFDKYFTFDTKIYYNDEYIYYAEARGNIKDYINNEKRIYCNSYGYDHDNFPLIGTTTIRFTTSNEVSGEEHCLDFKYLKGIFFIKPISLRLDSNFDTLYPVFFGYDKNK